MQQRFFLIFLMITLGSYGIKAQDKLEVLKGWQKFNDAKNSLYHDLADQAYRQMDVREGIISNIHSLSDWKQRQQWVRSTLKDIVGTFPEKTPLNARITKTIKEDDYTIEDIIYESQPKFYVTASLFIPDRLKKKAPAIIYCSGHSGTGYKSGMYQHVILNLVKKGFIVFAFDPVGQGERLQYYDPKKGASVVGGPSKEHSYPGNQGFILDGSQARYEIWDGIRAVDYLLTRKEVDPSRIGITGRSGGGLQTEYLGAFDDRIYAAAPECHITTFTKAIEFRGPPDAENTLTHEMARGIDMADFLEARAPKPTLMITTTRDIFPIQGAINAAKEISRVFKAYGEASHFYRVEADTVHASDKKNRESMYAFFQKYLDNPGDSSDLEIKPLRNGELQVTKTGQISTSIEGAETVFSLNRKYAEKLVNKLQVSRKNISLHLSKVIKAAKELSGYHDPIEYHAPVFTGRFQKNGYVVEKYFVKGDGDYVIPYLLMIPDHPNGKAVICLSPGGKSDEVSNGDMKWLVRKGFIALAPDLLGVGEIGSNKNNNDSSFSYFNNITFFGKWYLSIRIARSIAGIRTGDVIRLARLLKKNNHISEVYGLARKEMAPELLHAAAFDTNISRVILVKPYCSYRSIVMNRFYNPAFIYGAVPGALKAYDLPDLAASLASRKLTMINITDGNGTPLDQGSDTTDLSVIKAAYHYRKADNRLNIIYGKPIKDPDELFAEWIK